MQTLTHSHDSAPTQFVEADGVRWAYRRFGTPGKAPIVFIQHFRGSMDNHDSAITNALADEREVILFNNRGVASTTGVAPETFADIGRDAGIFIDALGLKGVVILGHSMGGFIGQELTIQRPDLVEALVLVGTAPRGGVGMQGMKMSTAMLFVKPFDPPDEMWGPVMFSASPTGVKSARAYLARIRARPDRDAQWSSATALAYSKAAAAYGTLNGYNFDYLKQIGCPTLVVGGSDDIVCPTINSYHLQQGIFDAKLLIYPDSSHGPHYQYHEDFVLSVKRLLDGSGLKT